MPEGVVFTKYEPCIFGDLLIKGETCTNDFFYQSLVGEFGAPDSGAHHELLDRAERQGESIAPDFDVQERDGLFDDDQLFAVWEGDDVIKLIEKLLQAVRP
jgi:hypothetical protein